MAAGQSNCVPQRASSPRSCEDHTAVHGALGQSREQEQQSVVGGFSTPVSVVGGPGREKVSGKGLSHTLGGLAAWAQIQHPQHSTPVPCTGQNKTQQDGSGPGSQYSPQHPLQSQSRVLPDHMALT